MFILTFLRYPQMRENGSDGNFVNTSFIASLRIFSMLNFAQYSFILGDTKGESRPTTCGKDG